MNLWHDKSYIAPSGPEWVERGYAIYDVHSVRFQFVYTEEQKKATLIHELIHGLDEAYIIGLKEKQVEKLGNALYMLIRDNPEMFKEG